MIQIRKINATGLLALILALSITVIAYWPGLSGSWLFDDYPNIVDNNGIHADKLDVTSLVSAALSSPASEFRRPLSSLSFAVNYLISGLTPFGWKLANLIIHLLNGVLVFVLTRLFITRAAHPNATNEKRRDLIAGLMAAGWMLLPINLTAVLYVVQREESLANLFILLGLAGYVKGRLLMVNAGRQHGFLLCVLSIMAPTAVGLMAKETAVMLPFYAAVTEWLLFGFRKAQDSIQQGAKPYDSRLLALFLVVLVIPCIAGLAWILPRVLEPTYWIPRNFTLKTRLLSEARIVVDYLNWTLLPTPQSLSFYHDRFHISSSLTSPWTTLASMAVLLVLLTLMVLLRHRAALVSLGIAFFLGGQLLTATILPLELIFEHRNYFASFGVLLAVVPPLVQPTATPNGKTAGAKGNLAKLRYLLLGVLMVSWTAQTAATAYAWGNPLRLSEELAGRAPDSPRAQYELGRTYVILSRYDTASPFTPLAHKALERAAALPDSTILPEQGLIFMNSRMHVPLEDRWWNSMVAKLKKRKSAVEDESALEQLSTCQTNGQCDLPKQRMLQAYLAALSHPNPSARLLNMYGMYAWEELGDHALGIRMLQDAVTTNPKEPAYRVTLIRMLTDVGRIDEAKQALQDLQPLNVAGHMDEGITTLKAALTEKEKATAPHSQNKAYP